MERNKKEQNIEIGSRLRDIRENLGYTQSKVAMLLNVCDEHYRKIESGSTGLTISKVIILYDELNIDPTFLLTGKRQDTCDIDYIMANSSKEEKNRFMKRVFEYMERMLTK